MSDQNRASFTFRNKVNYDSDICSCICILCILVGRSLTLCCASVILQTHAAYNPAFKGAQFFHICSKMQFVSICSPPEKPHGINTLWSNLWRCTLAVHPKYLWHNSKKDQWFRPILIFVNTKQIDALKMRDFIIWKSHPAFMAPFESVVFCCCLLQARLLYWQ